MIWFGSSLTGSFKGIVLQNENQSREDVDFWHPDPKQEDEENFIKHLSVGASKIKFLSFDVSAESSLIIGLVVSKWRYLCKSINWAELELTA